MIIIVEREIEIVSAAVISERANAPNAPMKQQRQHPNE